MPGRHLKTLAGLTALAAVLRFATLDLQSFWLDEAVTVRLVRMDLGGMLGAIPESESTPPLYYVLAWTWSKLLGTGEIGLRSLSALLGTAFVPVAYAAAARLVSPRAGLIAAALAATNPLLVWYSQEARAYALFVLLGGLSLLAFAHALERPGRRELALWATASALAVATHYFAIFLVAAEGLWLLRAAGRPRAVAAAIGAVAAVALALLPLLLEQSSRELTGFIGGQALSTRALQIVKQYLVGFDSLAEIAVTAAAALLAALGAVVLFTRGDREERRGGRIAASVAGAAVGVPLVLDMAGADYLVTRNVLAAWLPFAIVVAGGLGAQRAGRLGIGAAVVLCSLSAAVVLMVFGRSEFQRDDWRGLAEALGRADVARGLVISPGNGHIPLEIYLSELDPYPESGAAIGEIAVVAVNERRPGETPRPPRPAVVAPPLFTIVERGDKETFTLVRMRAEQPVGFPKIGLRALRQDTESLLDVELEAPEP